MYGWTDYEIGRLHREEIHQEVAMARLEGELRANCETRPYVVRDLSWELARFLDAEDFPAIAFATPDGANGNPPHNE